MANPTSGEDAGRRGPVTASGLPTRIPFAGPHPGSANPSWTPTPATFPLLPPPPPAPPSPPPARPSRRWLPVLSGAVVVAVLAGGFLWRSRTPAPTPVAGTPTTAAASAAGPAPTASHLPPPPPGPSRGPVPPKASANTAGRNLALNSAATASSVERDVWAPAYAVDGDLTTRWSSGFSDPQWLKLDLGARWQLSAIRLTWENAHATAYRVQLSTDGQTWLTVYRTTKGKGGNVVIEVPDHQARYVRIYGTKRSTAYGYSLLEVDIR